MRGDPHAGTVHYNPPEVNIDRMQSLVPLFCLLSKSIILKEDVVIHWMFGKLVVVL